MTMSVAGLGVKTDLEKLVKTFGETGTVRYEVFADIWRAMKMNNLCAGRQTEREAREFLEIVFDLIVPYWLPPFPFQTRICGLYILYGVYMTQPCQPKIKIRMTLQQWSEVTTFMEMVAEQKHLDVNFVFHKLRTLKAFHFVATTAENYPRSTEGEGEGDSIIENLPELSQSVVHDVINGNLLQQFDTVQNQYYNVKCNLAGAGATQPERSLNILNENLVLNIKEILKKFEQKRHDVLSRSTAHFEDSTGTDQVNQVMDQCNAESVGNKRRRIRNKAYGKQSSIFRSPKSGKKLVIDEQNSPGTGKPTGKGKGKGKGSGGSKKKKKKLMETLIGEYLEPEADQSELMAGIPRGLLGDFLGSSAMLDMPSFGIDTSLTGDIRCYCNESGCVSTGYMCKSSVGQCYSMLTYEGDITHSVHGCLDSVKMEDRTLCSGDRELVRRKQSTDWPVLLCCKDDMCNYIDSLDINIVVNTKSNGSLQRGHKSRSSSASGNRHVIHAGKVEEKNNEKDLWFKAAVIAVPIAGGFILILLVLLAVRMLRTDTQRHRRLLQIRRERSLTKAQLYVSDHFCSKRDKKNSKHLYTSQNHHNNSVYKDTDKQPEKEKLFPEKSREKQSPIKPHNSVIVWGKPAKNSDVATVV